MTKLQTYRRRITAAAAKFVISRKRNSADRLDLGKQLQGMNDLYAHHSPAHEGLGSYERELEALKLKIPLRTLQRIRREYLEHVGKIQAKKLAPSGGKSRAKLKLVQRETELQQSPSSQPIDRLDEALAAVAQKKQEYRKTQKFRIVLTLSYAEALEYSQLVKRVAKVLQTSGSKLTIMEALKYVDHSAQKADRCMMPIWTPCEIRF